MRNFSNILSTLINSANRFSQLSGQFLVIRNYAKITNGLFARIIGKISAMTIRTKLIPPTGKGKIKLTPNTRTLKGQSYCSQRWANPVWPKGSKSRGFSNLRGIYCLHPQFTNNCALSTVSMANNLWQP